MLKFNKSVYSLYLFLFMFSCSNTNTKPLIVFSKDSTSIIIKNIDDASLLQVRNAFKLNPDSTELLTVLFTPGDNDSLEMEHEIAGKIAVEGDLVVFKPQDPFRKGANYLVENYIAVKFASTEQLLKGGIKHNLQPQQQLLTR